MCSSSKPLRTGLSSTAFSALEPMSSPTMLFFFDPNMTAPRKDSRFWIFDFGFSIEEAGGCCNPKSAIQNPKFNCRGRSQLGTKREGCESRQKGRLGGDEEASEWVDSAAQLFFTTA